LPIDLSDQDLDEINEVLLQLQQPKKSAKAPQWGISLVDSVIFLAIGFLSKIMDDWQPSSHSEERLILAPEMN